MQTFLPYCTLNSVKLLDNKRLGKQRLEAKQILEIIKDYDNSKSTWKNHPAVRMWNGYDEALKLYINFCIIEWKKRGFNNTMSLYDIDFEKLIYPPFLGWEAFHYSHRCNLLKKNPEYYSNMFTNGENPTIPYVWPVVLKSKNKPGIDLITIHEDSYIVRTISNNILNNVYFSYNNDIINKLKTSFDSEIFEQYNVKMYNGNVLKYDSIKDLKLKYYNRINKNKYGFIDFKENYLTNTNIFFNSPLYIIQEFPNMLENFEIFKGCDYIYKYSHYKFFRYGVDKFKNFYIIKYWDDTYGQLNQYISLVYSNIELL